MPSRFVTLYPAHTDIFVFLIALSTVSAATLSLICRLFSYASSNSTVFSKTRSPSYIAIWSGTESKRACTRASGS